MDLGFPVTQPVSPGGAGPPAAHHAGSPEGQQPHGPYRGDVTSVTVSHITTLQADVCMSSRGGSRGSGTLRSPGHQQVGAGARGGPARGVTACCSLTPSRPGFNTYLPLPEDRTGRRLAVPHPDTPRPPRGSSQHHATPCRSADEPPPAPHTHTPGTEPPTRVLRRGCGAGGDWSAGRCCGEASGGWSWRRGSAGRFSVPLSPCGGERAGCGWRGLPERTRGWSGNARGRRIWGGERHSPPRPRPRRPTHPPQDPEGRCAGRQAGPLTEAPQALRVPSPELHSDMDAR